jgi:hypothetical protein
MLLVIMIVVTGFSACEHNFKSSCCSVLRVSASRALKGSSRNRIAGSDANARAIATRCRIPPESWLGRRCAAS